MNGRHKQKNMEKNSQDQFRKMTETPISGLILSLAAPTIASMMVTNLYNTADTWFVSRAGTSASGAVSVVFSLMAIYQAFGFMFGHGAGSNISRKLGEKREDLVKTYASTSLFLSLACGAAVSVLGLLFMNPLLRLLGSTETILPYARQYVFWVLLAGPLLSGSCVLNNILRYEGQAFYAMIGLMTGGILNMIGDPILMFGCKLGVFGAGISTAVSQLISFGILLGMFRGDKTISTFHPGYFARDTRVIKEIVSAGFPSLIRQGLGSFTSILLNHQAALYGDAAIAAMGIVGKVSFFISAVAIGIGQGFQPVAGFNYGARKYRRVEKACVFTMCASFCFLSVIVAACWFNAEALIKLFRDDPEVTAIALPAFRYQCFACFLQPVIVAGNMLFQSIGKSGRATFLACCRQGVFFIPLILALPRLYGLFGIEICQPIADVLTFFVTVPFLFPFLHQLVKMEEAETAKA